MYKPTEPKRRQFFKIATAGTVASAAGGLPMMFVPNAALAEDVLGSDTFATLVKIARDIFPHDRFDDSLYANAVGVYADQAKSDEGVKKLIQEGQTHDIKNLFISDGSQFTTGAAENPTLTIVALAIRQADYIAKSMARKEL